MIISFTLSFDKEQIENLINEFLTKEPKQQVIQSVAIPTPQFLSINDMCEMFKVSRVTISTWMKQGRIPFKKVSRRVYFVLSEVMESLPEFNLSSVHSFHKSISKGGKK